MSIAYRALAALGALAALHAASGALAETSSAVHWAEPRLARPAVKAALSVAPDQIGTRSSEAGVRVRQIDPRAAVPRKPVRSWFASWYLRRYCRQDGELSDYCKRMLSPHDSAASGDAPRRPSAELDDAVPILVASPAPYIPRHDWLRPELEPGLSANSLAEAAPTHIAPLHRPDWLHPDLEPSLPAFGPCNGVCQQFAGIAQSTSGDGINKGAIYQSGPNSALTVQQAGGTGSSAALKGQWGACNRALVVQAASSASNTSAVSQAGYYNTAIVNQH